MSQSDAYLFRSMWLVKRVSWKSSSLLVFNTLVVRYVSWTFLISFQDYVFCIDANLPVLVLGDLSSSQWTQHYIVHILEFLHSLLFYFAKSCHCAEQLILQIQEDGKKQIELKPGFLMEHEHDVCHPSYTSIFMFLFQFIESVKLLFLRLKLSKVLLKILSRWELLWLDLIAISTTTKFSRSSNCVFSSIQQSSTWEVIFLLVYGWAMCYGSLCSVFGT